MQQSTNTEFHETNDDNYMSLEYLFDCLAFMNRLWHMFKFHNC